MAYIELNNEEPGIRGLMLYSPATAHALNALAEVLLRTEGNTLTRGERELIAAHVSHLNDCFFCKSVHGAMAGFYMQCDMKTIRGISKDVSSAEISEKMKALLHIAAAVQKSGRDVKLEMIESARKEGATDMEIHDTVLIAAAFCMFNRYVDGLDTWTPHDEKVFVARAPMRARDGYVNSVVK